MGFVKEFLKYVNMSEEYLWTAMDDAEPVQEKKTYLNLYISPSVKGLLEKHARVEGRTLSNLTDRLLSWSARWLEEAGDSQTLLGWDCVQGPVGGPGGRPHKSKRVSEELQDQLHSALDIIVERGPSTVVDRLTEYLTSRAGKYGGD